MCQSFLSEKKPWKWPEKFEKKLDFEFIQTQISEKPLGMMLEGVQSLHPLEQLIKILD